MVGCIFCFIFLLLVIISGCETETQIADGMLERTICQSDGRIIKRTLEEEFKAYNIPTIFVFSGLSGLGVDEKNDAY